MMDKKMMDKEIMDKKVMDIEMMDKQLMDIEMMDKQLMDIERMNDEGMLRKDFTNPLTQNQYFIKTEFFRSLIVRIYP